MAVYRDFMSDQLIALDKQPGVCPVGVVKMWRRLFSKIVLNVMGPEATMACQYYQLCSGFKAGINSAIHGVQAQWYKNSSTKE